MTKIDRTLSGKRIMLLSTNDPYTALKPNDMGTIDYVIMNSMPIENQISVKWDSGSTLFLLEGIDKYKILDDVK